MPPLHAACSASFDAAENRRRLDKLRALLDAGADLDARDKDGWTALHVAARSGTAEMVALLLERGGDPNLADKRGTYPVHLALDRKPPILRALIEGGARADVKDNLGFTPAMRTKRKDLLAILKKRPAPKPKPAPDLAPLFAGAPRGASFRGVPVTFAKNRKFDECDLARDDFPTYHPIGDLGGRLLVVDGASAKLPVLVFDDGDFDRVAASWKAFTSALSAPRSPTARPAASPRARGRGGAAAAPSRRRRS